MNVNNILKFDKKDCYGCTACEAVCPTGAITFKSDEEGFYYPSLDENVCTQCGACIKVCNIESENLKATLNEEPKSVYAVWSKDRESVLRSTSGGAAYHLSRRFVENGGVVYGVAWIEHLVAAHVRVDTVDEIERLRGSKYVQSKLSGVFNQIKNDLKQGKKVLFIGTPCQVGGLKSIVKRRLRENLYTIDLVCHGTPSIKMFQAYIKSLEKKENSSIISFKCRGKKPTGWRAYEEVVYSNGKKTTLVSGRQSYFKGFYSATFSKSRCYNCLYSTRQRSGDVTLSDFWGSEKSDRRLYKERKYGYNFLACNSDKGKLLLESVMKEMVILESSYEIAVKGDVRFRESDAYPAVRDVIYKELDNIGYEGIAHKYLSSTEGKLKSMIPECIINLVREIQCRFL